MIIQISVVIPTYQRPAMLERCLQAVAAQRFDRQCFEIVVVDDGDDPATWEVVQSVRDQYGGELAIRCLVARDTQGPAAARNLGWRNAEGEILAFTDDDTIPDPEWLARGWEVMRTGAAAAAGHIHVPVPDAPTDYEADVAGLDGAEFATANCFVRKAALERIGGFDERFAVAWREDSDLLFNLLKAGLHVVRATDAVVVHPIRPGRWGVSLSQQRKIQYDALLYKKHPSLYREKIRSAPRWDYYLIVLSLLLSILFTLQEHDWAGGFAAGIWLAMTTQFCLQRLSRRSRRWRHVAEMAVTSLAIPLLATFWRVVGSLRFKVLFV
jgi:glycosyltransferase involved in cell wall biosynthesis